MGYVVCYWVKLLEEVEPGLREPIECVFGGSNDYSRSGRNGSNRKFKKRYSGHVLDMNQNWSSSIYFLEIHSHHYVFLNDNYKLFALS